MCLLTSALDSARAQDYALTVYSGRVTENKWQDSLSSKVSFVDAQILAVALAWTMSRHYDDALSFEIEGQAAKYFGLQDHLEFNLPIVGRWQKFPWNKTVDTSLAFGLGLSWATEEPVVEEMFNESTQQLLIYWMIELSLGPPDTNWALVLRLHHRSDAFGLIAEDGGSNTLAAGLKFRF